MRPSKDDLATTLSELARLVLRDKTLADDLGRLTRLTMRLIPSADSMSIALLVQGWPTTVAASGRVAIELDLIQNNEQEGPCLLALDGRSVRVAVLERDQRFPHFAIGASDLRIRSVLSTPIFVNGDVLGTMNIYSRQVDAFDDDDEAMSAIIATVAGNAIVRSELLTDVAAIRERLQVEFDEAAIISRAQAVLMGFEECSAEQAEALLRQVAQSGPEALIDVAKRVLRIAEDVLSE